MHLETCTRYCQTPGRGKINSWLRHTGGKRSVIKKVKGSQSVVLPPAASSGDMLEMQITRVLQALWPDMKGSSWLLVRGSESSIHFREQGTCIMSACLGTPPLQCSSLSSHVRHSDSPAGSERLRHSPYLQVLKILWHVINKHFFKEWRSKHLLMLIMCQKCLLNLLNCVNQLALTTSFNRWWIGARGERELAKSQTAAR